MAGRLRPRCEPQTVGIADASAEAGLGGGELVDDLSRGDEAGFQEALAALLDGVRTAGVPHDAESLDASDLILPMADASLAEVKDMLSGDGLIPG